MKIESFSTQSLQYIFVSHISREAKVTTDKWRGYKPIAKAYNISQIERNKGLNFKVLHTMIHQVKSWIRTTYSWVSDDNFNRNLFGYLKGKNIACIIATHDGNDALYWSQMKLKLCTLVHLALASKNLSHCLKGN